MNIKTATLFLALMGIAFPSVLQASDSWNVNSGDWSNSTNWTPSGPPASTDVAIISNSGTATLSSGSGTAQQIFVGNGGTGTSTGILDISGAGTTLSTGKSGSGIASYIGAANGTNGGSGTVILEDGASWTHIGGALVVGGGVLAGATGSAIGTLEVESGADLNLSSSNYNLAIGREAGGNGTVIVDGGSIEVGSTGNGVIDLATKVSGTGGTTSVATLTLNSGSITATGKNGANNGIQTDQGTSTINLNGGTLTTNTIAVNSGNTNNNVVHFNGTQIVAVVNNTNFFNGYKGNGDLDVASGGLNINSNGKTVGFQQTLSGVGALTKSGSGELDLYGANTYAGGTKVGGGLLEVESGALLGSGAVDVLSGGALEFQDPSFSLTAAGLTLESGSQLWLANDLTFDTLTIEGTNFAAGTYSYDQLDAEYGDIFSQGAFGSITVLEGAAVPEPSSLALLGLGLGAGIFLHTRRRLFSSQGRG